METAWEREALLPCPFCGGPVQLEQPMPTWSEYHGERQWWGVVCRNTLNRGGTCAIQQRPSASKEAAIDRWNLRAAPPIAPGEREALIARLAGCLPLVNDGRDDQVWCSVLGSDLRDAVHLLAAKAQAPAENTQAAEQLRYFAEAARFDRGVFRDDTAFADWVQCRSRHVLALADAGKAPAQPAAEALGSDQQGNRASQEPPVAGVRAVNAIKEKQ